MILSFLGNISADSAAENIRPRVVAASKHLLERAACATATTQAVHLCKAICGTLPFQIGSINLLAMDLRLSCRRFLFVTTQVKVVKGLYTEVRNVPHVARGRVSRVFVLIDRESFE